MNAHSRKTQGRWKSNYDRRIRRTPIFRPDNFIFIDKHSSPGTKSGISDNIATAAYSRLLTISLGSFHYIADNSHSLVANEICKHNRVPNDRTVHVPHIAIPNTDKTINISMAPTCSKNTATKDDKIDSDIEDQTPTRNRKREYRVDDIVRHIGSSRNVE